MQDKMGISKNWSIGEDNIEVQKVIARADPSIFLYNKKILGVFFCTSTFFFMYPYILQKYQNYLLQF